MDACYGHPMSSIPRWAPFDDHPIITEFSVWGPQPINKDMSGHASLQRYPEVMFQQKSHTESARFGSTLYGIVGKHMITIDIGKVPPLET